MANARSKSELGGGYAAAPKPRAAPKAAEFLRNKRFGVYLAPELIRRLKVACAERGVTLSDATATALESWLKSAG